MLTMPSMDHIKQLEMQGQELRILQGKEPARTQSELKAQPRTQTTKPPGQLQKQSQEIALLEKEKSA